MPDPAPAEPGLGGVVDLPAADESDIEGGAASVTDEEILCLLICRALGSRVGEAATGAIEGPEPTE